MRQNTLTGFSSLFTDSKIFTACHMMLTLALWSSKRKRLMACLCSSFLLIIFYLESQQIHINRSRKAPNHHLLCLELILNHLNVCSGVLHRSDTSRLSGSYPCRLPKALCATVAWQRRRCRRNGWKNIPKLTNMQYITTDIPVILHT